MQQNLIFVSRTTPNSRNIFTDAETNIQKRVLPSFFDTPLSESAHQLSLLANWEGRLNIKETIDYEMKYAVSLTACVPLEKGDQANALLNQERIMHKQRAKYLNET